MTNVSVNDVTVILPAKSVDDNLVTAIRSTLKALEPKSRILVHLDGCMDKSGFLRSCFLGENRLAISGSREPIGIAASLNRLIDQVRSPLIARMDADDICLRWRFSMQIRAMRASELDLVFSPVVLIKKIGILWTFFPQIPKALNPSQVAVALLFFNPLVHPTMLARTEVLREVGGYRNRLKEDYDLWLRLSASGIRIGRTAFPGLMYRIHPGQTTASEAWLRNSPNERNFAEIDALSKAVIPSEPRYAARMKVAYDQLQSEGALLRLGYAGLGTTIKRMLWKRSRK